MRYAIYFAPPPVHPLWKAASLWLGRDACSGEAFAPAAGEGLTADEIGALTAEPRRYGFHATLKAPFRLLPGHDEHDVAATLDAAARELAPVTIPRLRIERLGAFFALTPALSSEPLNALAAAIVRRFDHLRAPPGEAEVRRRQSHGLSPTQRHNLAQWGYPYVFADYRFHMSLTGPVPEGKVAAVERLLRRRFESLIGQPLAVDSLSLFVEPTPPGDFVIREQVPLAASPQTAGAA